MDQVDGSAKQGSAAPGAARRRSPSSRRPKEGRGRHERALLILAIVGLALGFLAAAPSADAAPAVRGAASDLSLVAEIRAGWPEATDLYLPSELPEGWRFSQPDDPRFWPDQDYENPGFWYVPMGDPEAVCAYSVAYTNGDEAIELSAGYWTASGGSRYFHELAENSSPVDIYLEGEQWKTFTYVDPPYDPGHEVLFVEWDGEGTIGYVVIDYHDAGSQAAAEALARAIVEVARLSPFSDVSDVSYNGTAIIVLAREGIVQGYDDGTFRPNNPVLRAQFAKMLVGALGLSVTNGAIPCSFADVPPGPSSDPLYPDDFVAVAAANGIVNGYDARTFGPYRQVTRIQMVSMVVRALEKLRPGRLMKPAADWRSDYAEARDPVHGENVRVAQYNGLLSHWTPWNPSDSESPEYDNLWGPATREEMAAMLYEALGGEFVALYPEEKASTNLAAVRAQLLAEVDATQPVYLPTVLPAGWAVAHVSSVDPYFGSPYSVTFTNGHSSIHLVYPLIGDASECFSGYFPTGVVFQGQQVEIGYDLGTLYCHVYQSGLMLIAPPWEREAVLALAASMEQVR